MISCFDDPKLGLGVVLCLEPEVACVGWMKSLPQDRNHHQIVPQESTIMVLDLGGGTGDTSIHIVCDRPHGAGPDARASHTWQLSEILSPAGGKCGPKAVDAAFAGFVAELFRHCAGDSRAHAELVRTRGAAALMDEFEQAKPTLTGEEDDCVTDVNLCDAISAMRRADPALADAQCVAGRWNAGREDARRLRATSGRPPPPPPRRPRRRRRLLFHAALRCTPPAARPRDPRSVSLRARNPK
jgi:hypothetical protein